MWTVILTCFVCQCADLGGLWLGNVNEGTHLGTLWTLANLICS